MTTPSVWWPRQPWQVKYVKFSTVAEVGISAGTEVTTSSHPRLYQIFYSVWSHNICWGHEQDRSCWDPGTKRPWCILHVDDFWRIARDAEAFVRRWWCQSERRQIEHSISRPTRCSDPRQILYVHLSPFLASADRRHPTHVIAIDSPCPVFQLIESATIIFRLIYLQLTSVHYKCQGQGHAYFNCEVIANDKR